MDSKKTILIVEDEKKIRDILKKELEGNDFVISEAVDGEEGVERALADHPDLILLDVLMPKMNGMETLKNIRMDVWGRKVPVVILTNLNPTNSSTIDDMIEFKPLFYLIKSDWKLQDVVEKIKGIFKDGSAKK